ncbi:hypothetical protein Gogos_012959, partial [Gossypium gossypioides]|nr:hypothetical protein [Gossypium gossypioides]
GLTVSGVGSRWGGVGNDPQFASGCLLLRDSLTVMLTPRLEHEEIAGFRAIIRNDCGRFVKCLTGFERALFSPWLEEAFATCEALSWLKSLHMDCVVLESDCMVTMTALVDASIDDSKFGSSISDRMVLGSLFQHFPFCWTHWNTYANLFK